MLVALDTTGVLTTDVGTVLRLSTCARVLAFLKELVSLKERLKLRLPRVELLELARLLSSPGHRSVVEVGLLRLNPSSLAVPSDRPLDRLVRTELHLRLLNILDFAFISYFIQDSFDLGSSSCMVQVLSHG